MRNSSQTFLKLLRYTLPFKKIWALGFIFLCLATLAEIAGPLLIKHYIDHYLSQNIWTPSIIAGFIIGYIVLQFCAAFFSYRQTLLFNRVAQTIIATLRQQTFNKALRLPARYLDTHQSGHLISTIGNDTETLMRLYVQVISQSLQKIVLLLCILGAMFALNARLAALASLMIGFSLLIMWAYQHLTLNWSRKARQAISQINQQISESLQGLPLIQSFVQEARFARQFTELNQTHLQGRLRVLQINGILLRPLIDLLYVMTLIGILALFAHQTTVLIPVGVIFAFVSYLGRMIEPLNDLTNQISEIQQSLIAGERIFTLLDQEEEPLHSNGYQQPTQGTVTFQNVWFRYIEDGDWTLQNINFTIARGQMLALIGHTGSGKSTILHLLSGFYGIQNGTITIDEQPTTHWHMAALRGQIGVIQQDPFILTGSVADNIRLGRPDITDAAMIQALQDVQWFDAMHMSPHEALNFQLDENGKNLSSGQRQLLSFARAIVSHPPILVLDEATAHVDSETEAHLQHAIETRRHLHTWLVVAHRLSTIRSADEIIVLRTGKIQERGTHSELLAQNGYYKTLYELQHQSALLDEMDNE